MKLWRTWAGPNPTELRRRGAAWASSQKKAPTSTAAMWLNATRYFVMTSAEFCGISDMSVKRNGSDNPTDLVRKHLQHPDRAFRPIYQRRPLFRWSRLDDPDERAQHGLDRFPLGRAIHRDRERLQHPRALRPRGPGRIGNWCRQGSRPVQEAVFFQQTESRFERVAGALEEPGE